MGRVRFTGVGKPPRFETACRLRIIENGTSRASVADQPTQSERPDKPLVSDVCFRCFSASTGTRKTDATTSPKAAAHASPAARRLTSTPSGSGVNCLRLASNVKKKTAEQGAEPSSATPTPR